MSKLLSNFFILLLIIPGGSALAQLPQDSDAVSDTLRQSQPVATPVGDVVDLSGSAVVIKAEPDRPRVNIISDRIKPRFDNINLEKSFVPELKGEGEHFVIRKSTSEDEFETVEIKNVLNKTRSQR